MLITANGQPHDIPDAKRFTCIVHQQGIRVDVPEAVEINSRNTIDCMAKMSQRAWEHISTGQLFRILFATLFPKEDYGITVTEDEDSNFPKPKTRQIIDVPMPDDASPDQGFGDEAAGEAPPKPPRTERWVIDTEPGIPIPATIEELNKSDFGIIHAAGMITLGCEAIFEGKLKLFFRNPEDTLHPKAERRIVDMLKKMMYFAGVSGVATEEAPANVGDAAKGIELPVDSPTPEPKAEEKPKRKPRAKKPTPKKKKK